MRAKRDGGPVDPDHAADSGSTTGSARHPRARIVCDFAFGAVGAGRDLLCVDVWLEEPRRWDRQLWFVDVDRWQSEKWTPERVIVDRSSEPVGPRHDPVSVVYSGREAKLIADVVLGTHCHLCMHEIGFGSCCRKGHTTTVLKGVLCPDYEDKAP